MHDGGLGDAGRVSPGIPPLRPGVDGTVHPYCARAAIRDNTVRSGIAREGAAASRSPLGDFVKIMVAAPSGWVTDALCGMLRDVAPTASVERAANLESVADASTFPDLILLDIDAAAAAASRRIGSLVRKRPGTRIVAYGSNAGQRFAESLLSAGALAYMPQSFPQEVVKGTLRLVLGNMPSTLPDTSRLSGKQGDEAGSGDGPLDFGLTRRQSEVLALVCEGKSNHAIGQLLGISEGTVKQHLLPIFDKMKVRNRNEAMLLGTRSSSVAFRQIRRAEGGKLDLDWLLGHMTYERLPRNTVLFRLGDPADELFYLQRGTVRLEEITSQLQDGALFGEIGIFAPNHTRTCSAVCESQVDVFKLTADQVKRLYMLNPQFGLFIVHTIATRLMADRSRTA